jgi:pimeloyl-ACP methyl ester carboxylesterase
MTTQHWTTGTVASGGEDVYYEVVGDGDATVMLGHGAGGSHAAWFQQLPALTNAGYRVVTWDTRGFGNSTFRSGTHGADASVADMAAVLDAVGSPRVHVVGQSMGGWWAMAFTLAHPERVQSLTLANTIGGLWTDALVTHFAAIQSTLAGTEARIGAHPALSPRLLERDPARAFLYEQLNTFHRPPMRAIAQALGGTTVAPADVDATGVPVLVITGTDDVLFPAPLVRESTQRLANVTIVEIADAGHSPYFERPDEWNAAWLNFVTVT